jgi:hypothetical protein
MTLVYSFDLDSTLADTLHRRHLIKDSRSDMTEQDWIDYSLACGDDTAGPAGPMLDAIIAQQSESALGVDFIVVSRRDNASREATLQWLSDRGWVPAELIMLKDEFEGSDERKHAVWKANAVLDYQARTGNRVVLHVDDWHAVTQYLLSVGIPAVTIRGDEEGEYAAGHVKEVMAS